MSRKAIEVKYNNAKDLPLSPQDLYWARVKVYLDVTIDHPSFLKTA